MLTRACLSCEWSEITFKLHWCTINLLKKSGFCLGGFVTNTNKSLRLWNYLDSYCLGDGIALRILHFVWIRIARYKINYLISDRKWSRNQTWHCTNFRVDDSFYWRIIMTWRYFQATTQERSVHGSTHACAYIWSLEKNHYFLKAFLSLTQDDWQIVRTILVSLCWYFLYPFIYSIKGRQETLHSGVKNEKMYPSLPPHSVRFTGPQVFSVFP